MKTELRNRFRETYGKNHEGLYFAPGRVNLIGEHTDYNGGHVFPCALDIGTYALVSKREDTIIKMYSMNFENLGVFSFDLNDLHYNKEDGWCNYPKGVIQTFMDHGYEIKNGFEILFFGNIPNGAGLSSSASIELATSVVLNDVFQLNIDPVEMVKLSQYAENKFVGVNCGIMDQFAIGMGKKDHAILLDTNTLQYKYASLKLEGINIVIANTNKRRGLADSKYNERRSECEYALAELQKELNIHSLGELDVKTFEEHQHLIQDEVRQKRAKHAVCENIRTKEAVLALEANDLKRFGELMNASHVSLRDDYEVTGKELDTLVEAAWNFKAIGSRMTGAGFGGCTVSLVPTHQVNDFISFVGSYYEDAIGYKASFYVVNVGDGARKIVEDEVFIND